MKVSISSMRKIVDANITLDYQGALLLLQTLTGPIAWCAWTQEIPCIIGIGALFARWSSFRLLLAQTHLFLCGSFKYEIHTY